MSAITRACKQVVQRQQQIISIRTSYQNPYYARFKKFKVSPDFHKQVSFFLQYRYLIFLHRFRRLD